MKRLLLIACCLTGFSVSSFAQTSTTLELINPLTSTSTVLLTPGSSFSLNIEVTGISASALDSFDLTLSGSTTASTALPAGITFIGFSNLADNFTGATAGSNHPTSFSAFANSTTDDITLSPLPTRLLTANFTTSSALLTGTYAIDFAPPGTFQNLYDADGDFISYVPIDATIIAVPEPKLTEFILFGFLMIIGLHFLRRLVSSSSS